MVIALIYRFTRSKDLPATSFPMTLVLLCVLIAMVTQVIGDNVARAFSLVGTLSIVRFRTVVRDTQDTAYVILSVIVGMAVGAHTLWVAGTGIAVVGLAELLFMAFRRGSSVATPPEYVLTIRAGLDQDPAAVVRGSLGAQLLNCELMSLGTTKQGGGVEASFRLVLAEGVASAEMIRSLAGIAGVQGVQLVRRGFDDD